MHRPNSAVAAQTYVLAHGSSSRLPDNSSYVAATCKHGDSRGNIERHREGIAGLHFSTCENLKRGVEAQCRQSMLNVVNPDGILLMMKSA